MSAVGDARKRLAEQQTAVTEAVIDAAHIEHQRAWSTATFGPREQRGPSGPLAHIRKEVEEVAADPSVLEEWVDVIILAFDGAWRGGHEPQQIIDAVKAKQAKNEARDWPDWREVPADQAIEHVPCGFHAWGPDGHCVTCGTAEGNAATDALTTAGPSPAGLPGYFVHPDGFGAPDIWQGTGPDDPTCRLVLEGWRVQAVAPDLWAAIAALVEGKP